MSRILIVTDAWLPQVNGVVRSIEAVLREAPTLGVKIDVLDFDRLPHGAHPHLPLDALRRHAPGRGGSPDRGRRSRFCPYRHGGAAGTMRLGRLSSRRAPFTTCYHTRFPEYLAMRRVAPRRAVYWLLRRFHNAGLGMMVATQSLERELRARGFDRLMRWSRGVDSDLFHPCEASALNLPRPIFLTCARLAVEKNLDAFLSLELPGSKVVVGDGPDRARLEALFPDAHFLGELQGTALSSAYASADAFIFPSLSDTFGLVLLEALASGVPIAAFPVPGPLDVIGDSGAGALDWDLKRAALAALSIPRETARAHALTFSIAASARQFVDNIFRAHAAPSVEAEFAG